MQADISPKVEAIFRAVIALFSEGADLNNLTVSEITVRAGIGKGTAYDYFSNKEEMIASALYYEMKMSCEKLETLLKQQKSIYDKIMLMLQRMEEQMSETSCFFRVMHLLQDNSALSSTMQKLIKEKEEDELLFSDLLRHMLEEEVGEKAEQFPEEISYLIMFVYSQFMCFGIYLNNKQANATLSRERMKKLICLDIHKHINEFTGLSREIP